MSRPLSPGQGSAPLLSFRVSHEVADQLEAIAERLRKERPDTPNVSRADAARWVIAQYLAAHPTPQKRYTLKKGKKGTTRP